MEIKTFQVGFVPISRAFHAHWYPKPAAHSDLDGNSKPRWLGLGSICFYSKPNHFLSTPSATALLWLSETCLEQTAVNKHFFKPSLMPDFPCSPSILLLKTSIYLPKTYLELKNFLFFSNTHCLNFLPKLVFFVVHWTQVSGRALSFKSTWLSKGAIKVNFSLYHTWSGKLSVSNEHTNSCKTWRHKHPHASLLQRWHPGG